MRYIIISFAFAAIAVSVAFACGWPLAEKAATIVVGFGFILALLYLINGSDKKNFG